RTEQDCFLA
ncbi:ATP-grasp domain protein, partial [Vibrio parahaemolyticus V-223/04]